MLNEEKKIVYPKQGLVWNLAYSMTFSIKNSAACIYATYMYIIFDHYYYLIIE